LVGLFEAWSFAFFHKLSTRAHARSSPTPSQKYDDTINWICDGDPDMSHPIAIVIAGALIAAAIALTNRWTLHSQVLVRMNNWTGSVEWVNPHR